jgi:acetate kinase
MGFGVLDGLVMATRCGRIDPDITLYLGRHGRSVADIDELLYRQSGPLRVSGISDDIRVPLASDDPYTRDAPDPAR